MLIPGGYATYESGYKAVPLDAMQVTEEARPRHIDHYVLI